MDFGVTLDVVEKKFSILTRIEPQIYKLTKLSQPYLYLGNKFSDLFRVITATLAKVLSSTRHLQMNVGKAPSNKCCLLSYISRH